MAVGYINLFTSSYSDKTFQTTLGFHPSGKLVSVSISQKAVTEFMLFCAAVWPVCRVSRCEPQTIVRLEVGRWKGGIGPTYTTHDMHVLELALELLYFMIKELIRFLNRKIKQFVENPKIYSLYIVENNYNKYFHFFRFTKKNRWDISRSYDSDRSL